MKIVKPRSLQVTGLAWYKPTQWKRLLEISADSQKLQRTYVQWAETATRKFNEMIRANIPVQRVDVDVEDLFHWCQRKGVAVIENSRSSYVAEKLREEYP